MNFTKGDIVPFYVDYMNDKGLLGYGLLIEKVRDALPESSYIKEDMPVAKQEVYGAERWRLKIVELTQKGESFNYKIGEDTERELGALIYIGIKTSSINFKDVRKLNSSRLVDNFEAIPGWGPQF
jgi:hypothetical protein